MSDMWKTFMQELAFNNAVSAMLLALQNPELKKKFKPAILKVFKRTWLGFGDDPDFQQVIGSPIGGSPPQ